MASKVRESEFANPFAEGVKNDSLVDKHHKATSVSRKYFNYLRSAFVDNRITDVLLKLGIKNQTFRKAVGGVLSTVIYLGIAYLGYSAGSLIVIYNTSAKVVGIATGGILAYLAIKKPVVVKKGEPDLETVIREELNQLGVEEECKESPLVLPHSDEGGESDYEPVGERSGLSNVEESPRVSSSGEDEPQSEDIELNQSGVEGQAEKSSGVSSSDEDGSQPSSLNQDEWELELFDEEPGITQSSPSNLEPLDIPPEVIDPGSEADDEDAVEI